MKNRKEKLVPELRFPEFEGEWKKVVITDVTSFIKDGTHGSHKDTVNGDYYLLSAKNIENGKINVNEDDRRISKEEYEKITSNYELQKGDILLSIVGTIGRTAIYEGQDKVAFQRSVAFFRFPDSESYFVYNLMNAPSYQKELLRRQVVSAQPGIYLGELAKIPIHIPSKQEQQKIASFLSLIDKKIELLKKKKELLELYKKGVMQKIFNREIRFKDKDGNDYPEWEEKRLGEIFTERSEKGFEDIELLSVTQDRGVIRRSEIEGVNNASDNRGGYKHVLPADIVYNSMRMWQGASGLSEYEGIVSPAYTVVYPKGEENMNFYKYIFKFPRVVYNFRRYSQGLTSDTWNLKYPQFSGIKLERPEINEQQKIGKFFVKLDNLLKKAEQQANTLLFFKRGLLRRMFV